MNEDDRSCEFFIDLILKTDKKKKTFILKFNTENSSQRTEQMFPEFIFLTNLQLPRSNLVGSLPNSNQSTDSYHVKWSSQQYVDSKQSKASYVYVNQVKKGLEKLEQEFDTVVVAPMKNSIQMCFQLFQDQKLSNERGKISFYIEPLLADSLGSGSINDVINSESLKVEDEQKYKNFYENFSQTMTSYRWLYEVLPQRLKSHINKDNININQQDMRQFIIKATQGSEKNLQTKEEFIKRLKKLKQTLIQYQKIGGSSNKKVLVIGSREVLNLTGATDYHENGDAVNKLRLTGGEIDLVQIVVDGQDLIRQLQFESIFSFCR